MSNCMIYTKLVMDPLQCEKCENLFCKKCIVGWQRTSKVCSVSCINSQFKEPGRMAKNMLGKLIFLCPSGSCEMKIPMRIYLITKISVIFQLIVLCVNRK
jgi:hypothetical protein